MQDYKTILCLKFMQSLLFLPLAIANALTARLNDGYVAVGCTCLQR